MAAEQDEDINVDQLLEEVNAPEAGRPMESGESPGTAEPEAPVWNGQEWEFESNGKKIVPDSAEKLKIWASQGFNYSQRMGDLNKTHAQRMAEIDQRDRAIKEAEKRFSPYAKVDEYAQQNKEWWAHVNQQYEAAQRAAQNPGLDPKIAEIIQPLNEKLAKLEQADQLRQQAIEQQQLQETIQKEDTTLDSDIKSIRAANANINFDAVDPQTGETLELQILKHAEANGLPSFKAGFWDYLGPKLIESAKAEGRGAVAKGKQADVRAGRLGTSQAPMKAIKPANTKAAWNSPEYDSTNILKEMGLGG